MQIESLKKYEIAANSIETTKASLLDKHDTLTEQLRFFTEYRDRNKLLDKAAKVIEADEAIQIVISKMEEVNNELNKLDLLHLAKQVWTEAEAI